MSEKRMVFTAAMVQAFLVNRKFQTRRVWPIQPGPGNDSFVTFDPKTGVKYRLLILGDPVVKKNSRSFSYQNGRPLYYKSERLELYEAEAFLQLSEQWGSRATIRKPCSVSLWFFKQRRSRCDVDNLACAALDALEKAQVLTGDELVVELHLYRRYDKNRPRTEIEIDTEVT